jgi:glycosyltransferase involved in cell wall biosynthesis
LKEPVSLIVGAYNVETYIEAALGSVLNSTYEGPIEVIVCYDLGTKDRTLDISKKIIEKTQYENRMVKVIAHEHTSPFRALLNYGFTNASGKFIAILDYDNLYPRDYIGKIVKKALETQNDFLFARFYYSNFISIL